MALQTIPITLTPGPVPPGFQAVGIDALIAAVCQYVAGAVMAEGQFIIFTQNDPATNQGPIIYNTTQHVFKIWNIGAGRYIPVFSNTYGDVKTSFDGIDELATGWIVLNGRAISAVSGLTSGQQVILENFFGVGGTLPTISPQNISGLPAVNAFGAIPWPPSIEPVVTPADGVIAPGLPFTAPNPSDTEVQAFANQAEILRDSVQDVFDVVKQSLAVSQTFLTAVQNGGTPPMYAKIFVGYP